MLRSIGGAWRHQSCVAPIASFRSLGSRRCFSTTGTAGISHEQDKEGDEVTDVSGTVWVAKVDKETGALFYYEPKTFETRDVRPPTTLKMKRPREEKPEYSTDWYDPRFPDWVQYTEFQSKRPYYHNMATRETTWSPPDQPGLDVFKEEIEAMSRTLTRVPDNTPPAPFGRRLVATGIDFGCSLLGGSMFGLLVFIDIDNAVGAASGLGFATWALFVGRDMIIERGTRSPGKKLMKLEIVKLDGQLPSRWNTLFRQIYLPVYMASSMLMPYIFAFSAFDLGLMLFTPQRLRLGDFIGMTRVIPELHDREERLKEKMKFDDEDDAKE